MNLRNAAFLMSVFFGLLTTSLRAQLIQTDQPPVIPAGYDAFTLWDRLPIQVLGSRACMAGTYTRGTADGFDDAASFYYREGTSENLRFTRDVKGIGAMVFFRANATHADPWHFFIDGDDIYDGVNDGGHHVVVSSGDGANEVILPTSAFPSPLYLDPYTTACGGLIYVPMPFDQHFRIAYENNDYATGYYIIRRYADESIISQPLEDWQLTDVPPAEVVTLLNNSISGQEIAPSVNGSTVTEQSGTIDVPSGQAVELATIRRSPAQIRKLWISIPKTDAEDYGENLRLRITWDDRAEPSIDAPLPLFFGVGLLYNSTQAEYLLDSFFTDIRYTTDRIELSTVFPMPFFKSAKLELVSSNATPINGVQWSVRLEDFTDPINTVGYFHATYTDIPMRPSGDQTLLDTVGLEGEQEWSGSFIGTSMTFTQAGEHSGLTRDPRFYFDDAIYPQGHGTGSEEWGGGGSFWRRDGKRLQRSVTPFAGHPVGTIPELATNSYELVNSLYRFLLPDAMPFGKNARIVWQSQWVPEGSTERRKTVTYWYGLPAASLVLSDMLDVGNSASEQSHAYTSPDATAPAQITSKYDVSSVKATETERHTTTQSEFTLAIEPDNHGVLLRRTLDWTYPNQEANVSVWDEAAQTWQAAGVWYTPGSTTYIHDRNGDDETTEVSSSRFREEELLLSKTLTQGKSELKLKVEFVPINRPLRPGDPLAEQAWSEIRYAAYSYVMPHISITADDSDADGIPDTWEEKHYGGATNANPDATASNGVNTVFETYIAGLDPTNAASRFELSGLENILEWNATAGRIYTVYWASNLLSGFQPLESNIAYTAVPFTDTNHSADKQGFYKIEVELSE